MNWTKAFGGQQGLGDTRLNTLDRSCSSATRTGPTGEKGATPVDEEGEINRGRLDQNSDQSSAGGPLTTALSRDLWASSASGGPD